MKEEKKTISIFEGVISYDDAKMYFDEGILPVCIATDKVVDRIKQDKRLNEGREKMQFTDLIRDYYIINDKINEKDDIGTYRVLNTRKLKNAALENLINLRNYIYPDNNIRYILSIDEEFNGDIVIDIIDYNLDRYSDADVSKVDLNRVITESVRSYSKKKMDDMNNEKAKVKKK